MGRRRRGARNLSAAIVFFIATHVMAQEFGEAPPKVICKADGNSYIEKSTLNTITCGEILATFSTCANNECLDAFQVGAVSGLSCFTHFENGNVAGQTQAQLQEALTTCEAACTTRNASLYVPDVKPDAPMCAQDAASVYAALDARAQEKEIDSSGCQHAIACDRTCLEKLRRFVRASPECRRTYAMPVTLKELAKRRLAQCTFTRNGTLDVEPLIEHATSSITTSAPTSYAEQCHGAVRQPMTMLFGALILIIR